MEADLPLPGWGGWSAPPPIAGGGRPPSIARCNPSPTAWLTGVWALMCARLLPRRFPFYLSGIILLLKEYEAERTTGRGSDSPT